MNNKHQAVFDFVVQEHIQANGYHHWDFMLTIPEQTNNVDDNQTYLATWKFQIPPINKNLVNPILALRIADHRKVYLKYQGAISDNRGSCKIFDSGTYHLIERKNDFWKFSINGKKINGTFILKKTSNKTDEWQMISCNNSN